MSACERLLKFAHIFDIIAVNNISDLQHLFSLARSVHVGIDDLLEYIQDTIKGTYHARGYTNQNHDFAILLYELGGAGAVYTVNHSHIALSALKII